MDGGIITTEQVFFIISTTLGSSVLAAIINHIATNRRDKRKERKELIAKAQRSVLRRVELCYRIRRRIHNDSEDIKVIRDLAHEIQEENQYYESLLLVESKWYGNRYSLYLKAIKKLTASSMQKAWSEKGNPSVVMEDTLKLDHEKIDKLSRQFSKDSRRFMFLPVRIWMRVHDDITRGTKKYDI